MQIWKCEFSMGREPAPRRNLNLQERILRRAERGDLGAIPQRRRGAIVSAGGFSDKNRSPINRVSAD